MTAKVSILLVILLIGISESLVSHRGGSCPLRNSVRNCMPNCVNDYQCSTNEKCCPNKCGSRSCAIPSAIHTGSDGGYKSSYDDAVYCAGVKCLAYEKCQFDRNSKREKCVRT